MIISSLVCSLPSTPPFLNLFEMPKYNSRPRKRRSALQKAQAKSLAQWRQRRKEAQQAENGISAGDDKPHTPTSSNVNQMIKERDRKVETLEKNCKNAVQRDKRGKEKVM